MKDVKEFHGKTLDDAIKSACEFYGVEREKLEIEIVNDSKMGIFGLVNVKKACVRAALASTTSFLEDLTETLAQPEPSARQAKGAASKGTKAAGGTKETKTPKTKTAAKSAKGETAQTEKSEPASADEGKSAKADEAKTAKVNEAKAPKTDEAKAAKANEAKALRAGSKTGQAKTGQNAVTSGKDVPAADQADEAGDARADARSEEGGEKTKGRAPRKERAPRRQESRPRRGRNAERGADGDATSNDNNDNGEGFALVDLASLNQEELHATIHDVVNRLVSSIIGEVPLTIAIDEGHIRVKVDCEEDARILVGREGQTLASVQYIASRILAGKLNGAVRLHIDTGNYKENQDARLTSLAQMLAEKLRKTGRTQSTRPLSAYQRRIVHLALEGEEDIQTSSKGEGPQRRVLIHFKRNKNQRGASQTPDGDSAQGADSCQSTDSCQNGVHGEELADKVAQDAGNGRADTSLENTGDCGSGLDAAAKQTEESLQGVSAGGPEGVLEDTVDNTAEQAVTK